MLAYNDLKKGTLFVLDGQPCEVLEYEFLRMQQRKPVTKTKVKNLITGKIVERNFHQNESFEEAEIEKKPLTYLYNNRGEYWFHEKGNPKARVSFKEEIIGTSAKFLKGNMEVTALVFKDATIGIQMPIKVDLIVKEAPPGIKGDTAQGGTKAVVLETGATINVPLFVNAEDVVRVNTETGEYVERMEKGR